MTNSVRSFIAIFSAGVRFGSHSGHIRGEQVFLEGNEQGKWIRPEYSGLFVTKQMSEDVDKFAPFD